MFQKNKSKNLRPADVDRDECDLLPDEMNHKIFCTFNVTKWIGYFLSYLKWNSFNEQLICNGMFIA